MPTSSLRNLAQRTHARSSTLHTSLMVMTLTSLFTLTASTAGAQYTYTTVDTTLAGQGQTHVTGTGEVHRVGTYVDNTGTERSWYYNGKTKTYSKITYPGKRLIVTDINAHVRTTGYYAGGTFGFTMQSGKLRTIAFPGANVVKPEGINAVHLVVGTYHLAGSGRWFGFLTNTGTVPTLLKSYDIPNAYGTEAYGINGNGDVVGGYLDMDPALWRYRGWMLTQGVGWSTQPTLHIGIDATCGENTIIRDINDNGLMAVTCDKRLREWPNNVYELTSYAYDGTTWNELAVPGAQFTHVTKLNNLGHFVGWYTMQDGSQHGFIAKKAVAVAQR